MFGRIKIDLETQKQMAVNAIDTRLMELNLTDAEEDFWEEVANEIELLTEDDDSPERHIKKAQRKLKQLRRAESRIKERLNPKL